MKKNKQCPKCHSLRVGWLESQPDLSGETHVVRKRPVAAVTNEGFFGNTYLSKVGVLEAYVCTECGYYESYVSSPGDTPWDTLRDFHWLNPEIESDQPYR